MILEIPEQTQIEIKIQAIKKGVKTGDEALKEKERRIYYQDIVYKVCNLLEKATGSKIVCGTVEEPSTQVQSILERLIQGS